MIARRYQNWLKRLQNQIIYQSAKLFADGAYDGNDIFRFLADNGILPCIKVRKNAKVSWQTGHILRYLSVISQRNDLQKWKDSIVIYGKRWIAETVLTLEDVW